MNVIADFMTENPKGE